MIRGMTHEPCRGETSAQEALRSPTHRRIYRFAGRRMGGGSPPSYPRTAGVPPAPNTQRLRSSEPERRLGRDPRATFLIHSRCTRSSMTERMYRGRLSPTLAAACDHSRISSVVNLRWIAVDWWTFMIKNDGRKRQGCCHPPALPPSVWPPTAALRSRPRVALSSGWVIPAYHGGGWLPVLRRRSTPRPPA